MYSWNNREDALIQDIVLLYESRDAARNKNMKKMGGITKLQYIHECVTKI